MEAGITNPAITARASTRTQIVKSDENKKDYAGENKRRIKRISSGAARDKKSR
jgi:hypothetical protein